MGGSKSVEKISLRVEAFRFRGLFGVYDLYYFIRGNWLYVNDLWLKILSL